MTATKEGFRFGVGDSEDDSRELLAAGKSGFLKKVTQLALVTDDGRRYWSKGDVRGCLKWMQGERAKRGIERWFWHNLQYDLGNLFGDDLDQLDLTMVGGRIIKARWEGLTFVDSFNLFPVSVKALGKAWALKKLKFSSTGKEYVFRDCEIVRTALLDLFHILGQFGIEKPANTLGGVCVQLWRSLGGKNRQHSLHFSRAALFGGRVELFQAGQRRRTRGHARKREWVQEIRGSIVWTDINSLYPWAMTQSYPDGPMRETGSMLKYGITRATVEVPFQPLAPLPLRVTDDMKLPGVSTGAILFPCGRFTGTWVNAELRQAVEQHGVRILKIHQSIGTSQGSRPYARFVREFYRRRMEEPSDAYRLIYKLLLNNLYGQLGMQGVITRTTTLTPELIQAVRDGRRDAFIFGEAALFDTQIPLPAHVNYAHAAHVTAYGRMRLMEFMRKVGPERLIYCDTDSLFFTWNPQEPLPFVISKSELGEMKLEGRATRMQVLLPKTYLVQLEGRGRPLAKAKGVRKSKALGFVRRGHAEYAAPFKIREAINFFDQTVTDWRKAGRKFMPVYGHKNRGNARKLSVWRKVKKELQSSYEKKRLNRDGYWQPLVLK